MPRAVRANRERGIADERRDSCGEVLIVLRAQDGETAAVGRIQNLIEVEDVGDELVRQVEMGAERGPGP
jgi:hypothetical protein